MASRPRPSRARACSCWLSSARSSCGGSASWCLAGSVGVRQHATLRIRGRRVRPPVAHPSASDGARAEPSAAAPRHGGDRGMRRGRHRGCEPAVHPHIVARQADRRHLGREHPHGDRAGATGGSQRDGTSAAPLPPHGGEYQELVKRHRYTFAVPEDADSYLVRGVARSRSRRWPRAPRAVCASTIQPSLRSGADPAPDRRSAGRDLGARFGPEPAPVRLVPAGMTVRLRTWGPSVASVPWQITAPGGCLTSIEPSDRPDPR